MGTVLQVLNELRARSGAQAAMIVSADGLVLDAVHDGDMACDALAAHAASHVMTSEQLGNDVQFGIPDAVIVMYRERALLMASIGSAVLVLVGAVGQLGYLRLQLRRSVGALAAALHDELHGEPFSPATQLQDSAAPRNGASPGATNASGVDPESSPPRRVVASTGPSSRTGMGPARKSSKQ